MIVLFLYLILEDHSPIILHHHYHYHFQEAWLEPSNQVYKLFPTVFFVLFVSECL